jgi:hypothetical protein
VAVVKYLNLEQLSAVKAVGLEILSSCCLEVKMFREKAFVEDFASSLSRVLDAIHPQLRYKQTALKSEIGGNCCKWKNRSCDLEIILGEFRTMR